MTIRSVHIGGIRDNSRLSELGISTIFPGPIRTALVTAGWAPEDQRRKAVDAAIGLARRTCPHLFKEITK